MVAPSDAQLIENKANKYVENVYLDLTHMHRT